MSHRDLAWVSIGMVVIALGLIGSPDPGRSLPDLFGSGIVRCAVGARAADSSQPQAHERSAVGISSPLRVVDGAGTRFGGFYGKEGPRMLKDMEPATMIPVRDLERTRRFYEDVLGFTPDIEDPGGISYRSASGRFNIYPTQFAGTAQHTLIGWHTDDIEKAVDELTAKGVTFEQYDMGELKTDAKGIADMGQEKAAWFKDPEGNILSVWQVPAIWLKK